MIQAISTTKLHRTQNVQAFNGVQNTQKPQTNASAEAPQTKDATLGAMAANIKQANAKNGGVTNFKGTKEDLLAYLKHQIQSGDLDIEKGTYTKVVKTNDGTTYTITIKKPEGNKAEYFKKMGNKKSATIIIKNNANNEKETQNFSCHPELYKNDTPFKKEYAEMKKKYGEI